MTKTKAYMALAILLLCGCCSKRHTVKAVETRHADTVATMEARRVSTLERETVTERLVMRPDSLGRLVVVARDVVRTTDRGTTVTADTAERKTEAMYESVTDTVEEETVKREPSPWPWLAAVWVGMTLLVTGCALVLVRKGCNTWTSRD